MDRSSGNSSRASGDLSTIKTSVTAETDLLLTITRKVIQLTNRSIEDLPPLYDVINSSKLEKIISDDIYSDGVALTLGFTYCGCRITYNNQTLLITSL